MTTEIFEVADLDALKVALDSFLAAHPHAIDLRFDFAYKPLGGIAAILIYRE